MAKLAAQYDMEPAKLAQTLVATVFPKQNATNEQLAAFCLVAWEYKLNPLTKQIYAFPQGNGIIPIISVDGWYALANRQPEFDGIEFSYIEEDGKVIACTATVHRKDRKYPTEVTEYVSECKRSNSPPWNTQPRRMIRHRAAIQAFRVAFGLSALDPDEAARIPEYEIEAGGEETQVHAPTLEGAKAKLDAATQEEQERGSEPKSERRQRRSRAVTSQKADFEELIRSGEIDPSLISQHLPEEGDAIEDAFAFMWRDDAEAILERARGGEFKTLVRDGDPAPDAELGWDESPPEPPPPDDGSFAV